MLIAAVMRARPSTKRATDRSLAHRPIDRPDEADRVKLVQFARAVRLRPAAGVRRAGHSAHDGDVGSAQIDPRATAALPLASELRNARTVRFIGITLLLAGLAGAVTWTLLPTSAGACSCADPSLVSELEPVDGAGSGATMCLVSGSGVTLLAPCDANVYFDDETFQVSR
jgi:hypothetical protein